MSKKPETVPVPPPETSESLAVGSVSPIVAMALQRTCMPIDLATGREHPRPEPGAYTGESIRLLLSYALRIGQPYKATVAAAVPWQRIAILALGKLNLSTAEAIVNEALAEVPLPEEPVERVKAHVERLKAPAERECQGRVTGFTVVAQVAGGRPG